MLFIDGVYVDAASDCIDDWPSGYQLLEIDLPDTASRARIYLKDLPTNWMEPGQLEPEWVDHNEAPMRLCASARAQPFQFVSLMFAALMSFAATALSSRRAASAVSGGE